jgi:hypothetical protein
MQGPVESPTPSALADLVARCAQIDRFAVQLVAAEESRVAALAAAILVMRGVLELEEVPSAKLPPRQGRIRHWSLTGGPLDEFMPAAIRGLRGALVIDEHEQVKILSDRSWKGTWRTVTLWRNGVHEVSSSELMTYLAKLASYAQERAPAAAQALLERSKAVAATCSVLSGGPRSRAD